MKKIIAAMTALLVCAAMLTACGEETVSEPQNGTASISSSEKIPSESDIGNSDSGEGEEHSEENGTSSAHSEPDNSAESNESDANGNSGDTAEDDIPPADAEAEIVFEDDEEEEKYSEPEDGVISGTAFDSLSQLAETGLSSLPLESVSLEKSNTYNFLKTFDSAKAFHLTVADASSNSLLTISFESKSSRIAVTEVRGDIGMILPVIADDSKMYLLDPMNMTGVYVNIDKNAFTSFKNDILIPIGIDKEAVSASKNIDRCEIAIGGKKYTFEHSPGGGFLYESDGSPYAIVSYTNSLEPVIWTVNEFSESVPEGVFDIPEGYELFEDTGADLN